MKEILQNSIQKTFGAKINSCTKIGGGASGLVYKVEIDKTPFYIAIKTSNNIELLKKESQYIQYINKKVDIKLPIVYDEFIHGDIYIVVMEYFDGKNCAEDFLIKASENIRLSVASQIADNIIKLQNIKGVKYGELLNPVYDSWHDYYRPFVSNVIAQAEILLEQGLINQEIMNALRWGEQNYDNIFDEEISPPTIIHGDYWAQNIIINDKYELIGVVDPFNCMWADSEYELFALNAIYGEKLPVLEAFLSKTQVSKKFFLKNYYYLLVSETFWVVQLHHDNIGYLMDIKDKLDQQIKALGIGNNKQY